MRHTAEPLTCVSVPAGMEAGSQPHPHLLNTPGLLEPLQSLVLPKLPAVALGMLACTCKRLKQMVDSMPLEVWQAAAAEALPPHPSLHTRSRPELQQLVGRYLSAKRNLYSGACQVTSDVYDWNIGGMSPERATFSPDGSHMMYLWANKLRILNMHKRAWHDLDLAEFQEADRGHTDWGWLCDANLLRYVQAVFGHDQRSYILCTTFDVSKGELECVSTVQFYLPCDAFRRGDGQLKLAPGARTLWVLWNPGWLAESYDSNAHATTFAMDMKMGKILWQQSCVWQAIAWRSDGAIIATQCQQPLQGGPIQVRTIAGCAEVIEIQLAGGVSAFHWYGDLLMCYEKPIHYVYNVHGTLLMQWDTSSALLVPPPYSNGILLGILPDNNAGACTLRPVAGGEDVVCEKASGRAMYVRMLAWSPDGLFVAAHITGVYDAQFIVWECMSGRRLWVSDIYESSGDRARYTYNLAWSPHGCSIAFLLAGNSMGQFILKAEQHIISFVPA